MRVSKDDSGIGQVDDAIEGAKAFGEYLSTALAHTTFETPTDFARAAHVSAAAVNRWVNGKQRPSPRLLERIAPHLPPSPGSTGDHADVRDLTAIAYPAGRGSGAAPGQLTPMAPEASRLNRYLSSDSPLSQEDREELRRSAKRMLDSFSATRSA